MLGSPANNIHFRNSYCNGGHGLSIGPMGKGSTVDIQNVVYVIHTLKVGIADSTLQDRGYRHGRTAIAFSNKGFTYLLAQENSLYGARFKSWISADGIARKCEDSPLYSQ